MNCLKKLFPQYECSLRERESKKLTPYLLKSFTLLVIFSVFVINLIFPQYVRAEFISTPDGGTVAANDTIYASVLSPNGSTLYVGGAFTSIGGQTRNRIAAISTSTGTVTSFDPNISTNGSSVRSLAISSDGLKLYVGGTFATIGGVARARLAAVDTSNGTVISAFNPNANNASYALALSSNGSILYAGGAFTTIGGTARNRLAAINTDNGTLVSAFNPSADGSVQALVLYGSILYAGGDFTTIGGVTYNHLAAINTDNGTAVSAFNPNVDNGVCAVSALALSSNGSKIYEGGSCTTVGVGTYNRLAAVDTSNGTVVSAFNPNVDNTITALTLSSDNSKLYVGGSFSTIGGVTYNKLAAVNTSNGIAISVFNPNVSSAVRSLVLSSDNSKLYVGGAFYQINGDSAFTYFASFTNDTTTPSVPGIPQATIGTNLTSQDWTWTASTDAGSGMKQYDWRVDGGPSGTTTTPSVTTNLATGNWKFYVKAEDNAGNQSTENSSLLSVFSSSVYETTIDCSVPLATIVVPSSVTNAKLDLTPIAAVNGGLVEANINCGIILKTILPSATVIVNIPAGAVIKGSSSVWSDKVLIPPTTTTTTTTVPAPSGYSSKVSIDVIIGHTVAPLDITKGVRIFMEGQAGKKAGYISNNVFTEITSTCSADSQSVGDALGAGQSCKIDSGTDLVIWTKHFTEFVTYDLVLSSTSTSSDNSSSNSSSSSTPGCNNSITSGKPDLFEIRTNDKTATLYFAPPSMPYSSFYIAYSRKSDLWEYGAEFNQSYSPGVIKETVNLLSPNTKYYFKIRAGNGCASGNWGNTMIVTTTSSASQKKTFYKNVFTAAVQNVQTVINKFLPKPTPTPATVTTKVETPAPTSAPVLTPAPTKPKFCLLWWCF